MRFGERNLALRVHAYTEDGLCVHDTQYEWPMDAYMVARDLASYEVVESVLINPTDAPENERIFEAMPGLMGCPFRWSDVECGTLPHPLRAYERILQQNSAIWVRNRRWPELNVCPNDCDCESCMHWYLGDLCPDENEYTFSNRVTYKRTSPREPVRLRWPDEYDQDIPF